MLRIPFHKPLVLGNELSLIAQILDQRQISGDGQFTQACARLLEQRFHVQKSLMTPSCTAALEMAVWLSGLKAGDEVIMPSFTFASTANAVLRSGATPVFIDLRPDTLNLDEMLIEQAITSRTRAIIPVHYAGVACEITRINAIAERHGLYVIEDAAQAIDAYYDGQALGSFGHFGAYSFHNTKNVTCGEGGALCINRPEFLERAEIMRDKGTNRQQFLRGEVDRYAWVDQGSSYVPSEILCAFLYAQLQQIAAITARRCAIYEFYHSHLKALEEENLLILPIIPQHCRSNYHTFFVLLPNREDRDGLITHLYAQGIGATFHYVPLHTSPMGRKFSYQDGDLPLTENLSERILRLPVYHEISETDQEEVVMAISQFLQGNRPRPISPARHDQP